MSKREKRLVTAFLNCIKYGEYSVSYAITLIEDQSKYGWLSDTAKDYFYAAIELEEEPTEEAPVEE